MSWAFEWEDSLGNFLHWESKAKVIRGFITEEIGVCGERQEKFVLNAHVEVGTGQLEQSLRRRNK